MRRGGYHLEKCDNDRGENLTVYKPRRGVERESARLHRANRYYVLLFRNPGIPRFVTETTSGSTAADYQPRACTRSERRNFQTILPLFFFLSLSFYFPNLFYYLVSIDFLVRVRLHSSSPEMIFYAIIYIEDEYEFHDELTFF